jgi:tartrate dehydratase beta subunit/fumarate hydratase class I family protein
VLFSCEVDSRKDERRQIETISGNAADAISRDPAVRRLVHGLNGEELPFELQEATIDTVVVGSDAEVQELKMELVTPRVQLQARDTTTDEELL